MFGIHVLVIMPEKFKGKYRISSTRRKDWNYGDDGAYFITICTKNRIKYFGRLLNGSMHMSGIGNIAHNNWIDIPHHAQYAFIDEFIIMPDHIHGIIIIDTSVETLHATSLQDRAFDYRAMSKISPKHGTLPVIIRSYKSAVTKQARKINPSFAWQERYYDRVIRDRNEYLRVQKYIRDNPLKYTNPGI